MIEVYGDLWRYPASAVVVTTNGAVRKDGAAVMGRGCAKQATERYQGIEHVLGRHINLFGNHVALLLGETDEGPALLSFPVKEHWQDRASLELIVRSAKELVEVTRTLQFDTVVMPRPGCGNGRCEWGIVKPLIEGMLDDRFHVIHREGEMPA